MGRIVTAQPTTTTAKVAPDNSQQQDDRMTRIIKYIPSEVIAGYLAMKQLIPSLPPNLHYGFYLGNVILFFVLNIIYLRQYANAGDPLKTHVVVSSVAFIIWTYCVDSGLTEMLHITVTGFPSILLLLFSIASGFIVPKQPVS